MSVFYFSFFALIVPLLSLVAIWFSPCSQHFFVSLFWTLDLLSAIWRGADLAARRVCFRWRLRSPSWRVAGKYQWESCVSDPAVRELGRAATRGRSQPAARSVLPMRLLVEMNLPNNMRFFACSIFYFFFCLFLGCVPARENQVELYRH